ncbi:MAG TPA: multicopper oxidase family protein [Allosphingosinicella sp.]|jgi:FtsP/CotA-like multicopper oxidase with cupredoxin domain
MTSHRSSRRAVRASSIAASALAVALLMSSAAQAQIGTDVADPPALLPLAEPSAQLPGGTRRNGDEQVLDLNIQYVPGRIFNPATAAYDDVNLRSYTRPGVRPNGRYISPAIHTRPGQTVRVKLHNKLPADPTCDGHSEPNKPHCFNGTNLHSHGLWVNPSGNGDNVLLSIDPGVSFEYEYAIPADHPAGTFWYHTHRHGSTALQVSSGMAGALIVHGNRLPTARRNGDLDTLLGGIRERVMVLQQIQYGCRDKAGNIKVRKNEKGAVVAWICDNGDTGDIETYSDANGNGFGSRGWGQSARYTSINGLILPDFRTKQGQLERWRMIHGGVHDTIALRFLKARSDAPLKAGRALSPEKMEALIAQSCTGEPLPYHLVAADGITLGSAQRTELATFQPGYRFDALVVFPEAGSYCVVDSATKAAESVGGMPSGSRLLGMVRAAAGTPVPDIHAYVTDRLAEAAQRTMPAPIAPAVVADLRAGLKLSRFTPHADVADGEIKGRQELTFNIQIKPTLEFQVGGQGYEPREYKPGRLDRKLTLGTAEEWSMTSTLAGHPFHIHVNPFQVVSILDPQGRDVSGPEALAGADPQYRGFKGMWKDTVWVEQGYTLKMRTRYQRYIGEFVLHCHILDHEDQGMMQNVAIVLPGGTPASVNAPEAGHGSH